ncbi:MAG TPA: ABC transporter permease [Acidimicrobiia bacterium]|nr:ABC transporter permease [Acidimicrobiia bacterium]
MTSSTLSRSLRYAESEVIAYRRTWRGTVITSFVNPVFFLAAMGAGLGALVDEGSGQRLSISYLAFVASGLMAANAMQNGAGDGSFPVMAGILWRKNFHGTVTTPLGPKDIVWGRLIWGVGRLTFTLLVFAVIAFSFGALEIGPALAAIPPAILTGVAFTTAITAWTLTQKDGRSLSTLFRFLIVPMFLFSGTFFPISQLPDWLEPVAYATPLFHGVELVRKISLPGVDESIVTSISPWVHVAYLVVMSVAGLYLSIRLLDRRIRQ